MKGQFESKVTELENEKQKAIKDGTIGSKIKEFDTRTKQLKKAIKAIDGHIAIREVDVTHGTHGPETPHEKW